MATIPISKPFIRRKDMDAVLSCLVNDEIAPGKASTRLEKQLDTFFKGRSALALREYRRAVEVALKTLDLPPGAVIAMSPLTHPVYPLVARDMGYVAAMADVEESSPVLSPGSLTDIEGLAAVVVDSPLGMVANVPAIVETGVPVLEDVSGGFGATLGEQPAGTFGHVTVVALEANHILTAAGGAVVIARNRGCAGRLKELSAQLLAESRLSDLNAALGITQMAELQKQLTRREELAERFARALSRGHHSLPVGAEAVYRVWPSFSVVLQGSLKDAATYARKHGVETEGSFASSYLARHATAEEAAPALRAQGFLMRTLSFPLYPRLSKDQISTIERVLATLP